MTGAHSTMRASMDGVASYLTQRTVRVSTTRAARIVVSMNALAMSALYGCGSRGTDETLIQPPPTAELSVSANPSLAAQAPIVFRSDRGQPGMGDLYVM